MNNNFKNFLKEKKDLLIFVGVLIVTFISVLSIARLANKDEKEIEAGGNIIIPDPTPTPVDPTPIMPQPDLPKIQLPLKQNHTIKREFFDLTGDMSLLEDAVKTNGTTFIESKGISYGIDGNKVFDVYNICPGEVISVSGNAESLEGYTVSIKHDNQITSVYSSLSSVTVKVGDKLDENVKIGVSGTTLIDIDAGIHVHLEVLYNGKYINPKDAIGKELSELVSMVN